MVAGELEAMLLLLLLLLRLRGRGLRWLRWRGLLQW
jgi:hypothetical protein